MEKGKVIMPIVTKDPKAKSNINYKQLGSSGLRRHSGYVHEEFLSELRWPWAGRIYQEMSSNDPTIGSVLYLAEMLIRGSEWTVKPASDKPVDVEAAKFLETCMHDMDQTWANTICEIISMITFGFSFHEIVYKIRRGPFESSPKYKSKYSDCRVGWRRLPIRSQLSWKEWEFNEEGDVTAFIQQAEPDFDEIRIPMTKGLLFRTTSSRDNPEGKSLLRNAYRPWYFKKHFEEVEGIGIERDLAGFPVLTAPEGLDLWSTEDPRMVMLKGNAEQLVANVRRDSEEGVLLPYGWKLALLSSTSSRQINIGDTIERYDKRIAITMLSDIILLGDKSGSFALADAKQSMLAAALQAHLANIADVFNGKAIPDLFYSNDFDGITDFPKLVPGQILTPSLKEIALMLRAWGMDITKDYSLHNCIRRLIGVPEIAKDDFDELYAKPAEEAEKVEEEDEKVPGADEDNNAPIYNKDDPAQGKVRNDTAERDLEQNDMAYTGAGGE